MTMPDERTRNLVQAGAFLRQLSADIAVPKTIRAEAHRLLRHFPTISDVQAIAANEARLIEVTQSRMHRTYLVQAIDDDWLRGYPRGPHIGG